MAGSVFDSALFAGLFPTGAAGRLFNDSAEIRAMLLVEGKLAQVQGAQAVIPAESGEAIARAAMEVQIDAGQLAEATGRNGVSVPALVAAFRSAMEAPEHAQYVHWGATSQDVIDTGLMLRLRQALAAIEADLLRAVGHLADMADGHAALPVAARTYGQHAVPTSFGAVAAGWGAPLLDLLDELPELRRSSLLVSLSGAAGTAGALGPQAGETRARLALALGLTDPGRSWHTDRAPLLRIAAWMGRLTAALGKIGEDLIEYTQTGVNEVRLGGAGGSSTMPQKQNPVAPSALAAIAHQNGGLQGSLHSAALPRFQRDGVSWFTEWMCLPQLVLGTASSALIAADLLAGIEPDTARMAAGIGGGLGLIHAEALSFALTTHMPRPDAQAAVKALCREAIETQTPLSELVARDHAALDAASLFDPARQMGHAPEDARAFAARARDVLSRKGGE